MPLSLPNLPKVSLPNPFKRAQKADDAKPFSLPKIRLPNPFKRGQKAAKKPESNKEALKKKFLSEAHKLKASVNDAVLHDKAHDFFKLVRTSLQKLFSIDYECTFDELKKELESRHVEKKLKTQLRVFLEELEILEYDFPASEDKLHLKSAKERSEVMQYLQALKAEGRKVDKKIEQDIESVFKGDLSDSSLLLIKYIEEFEELLKRI